MAIQFVLTNQLVNANSEDFAYPNNPNGAPGGMLIPCPETQIIGSFWRIPQAQGNRIIGWNYIVATTSVKPRPDALKVLSVKFTTSAGVTQVYFAILDSDNVGTSSPPNQFAYLCDGLGGTLPVMPTVTIPLPILQSGPQITDNTGDNTFIYSFPSNPDGLEYVMAGVWFNGLVPTPAYAPSGITTVAEFVTWANANWSTYGTFTALSATTFQLYSPVGAGTPVNMSGMIVTLAPVDYCFDLTSYSTPQNIDGVKFGTGNIISVPAFQLTDDPTVLMNVLHNIMSAGTIFDPTSVAHSLGINTTQDTPKLYLAGVLKVTADSGTC